MPHRETLSERPIRQPLRLRYLNIRYALCCTPVYRNAIFVLYLVLTILQINSSSSLSIIGYVTEVKEVFFFFLFPVLTAMGLPPAFYFCSNSTFLYIILQLHYSHFFLQNIFTTSKPGCI